MNTIVEMKEEKEREEAPDSFICPITGVKLIDPVILPNGKTVEREAIEEWIKKKGTCPFTRARLEIGMLIPNRDLRDLIEQFSSNYRLSNRSIPIDAGSSDATQFKDITISSSKFAGKIVTEVEIPESIGRQNIHVCVVFDKSGSMNNQVISTDSSGNKESDGTTLIDLVKQSAKSLVKMLGPNDKLSFLVFDRTCTILMNPTSMDSIGQIEAISIIDSVKGSGGTNMWDGINTALGLVKSNSADNIISKIIIFTDGVSNTTPPKGELQALIDYSEENSGYPCTMDFIGFGSGDSINTEIGYPLANVTGGKGYYISDGSMIGNVFSSLIGILLSCLDFNSKLYFSIANLDEADANKIFDVENLARAGYNPEIIDNCTISIQTGPLVYGTQRHFRIPVLVKFEEKDMKISVVKGHESIESTIKSIPKISFWKEMDSKSNFIDVLAKGFFYMKRGEFKMAENLLEKFVNDNRTSSTSMFPSMIISKPSVGLLENIIKDVSTGGEVKKAFDPTNFNKWGKHYIPLLKDAHVYEYPNNFKDVSIQGYASKILDANREAACKIFEKTPMIPTGTSTSTSTSTSRTMDPNRFGKEAGCFHGLSTVKIIDPSTDVKGPGEWNCLMCLEKTINVEDVRPGDKVFCGKKWSIVEKILVTRIATGFLNMVRVSGPYGEWIGTPNHPVKVKDADEWIHPKKLGSVEYIKCNATYSFLFKDRNPSLYVNGIESVSLAHGLKGDVVEHDFFGEEEIVKSMEKIEEIMGYHDIVTVEQNWFNRNEIGMISEIHPYSDKNGLDDLLMTKKWHCSNC